MLRNLLFLSSFFLVSCANNRSHLMQADLSGVQNPREKIELAISREVQGNFIYYDRSNHILYIYGKLIHGFSFRSVNLNALKIKNNDLYQQIKCTQKKICVAQDVKLDEEDECLQGFNFRKPISRIDQDKIFYEFYRRGYPIILFELRKNQSSNILYIRYFTECEKIKEDLKNLIPELDRLAVPDEMSSK